MKILFISIFVSMNLHAMEVLKAKGHKAVIKHLESDGLQVGQILDITAPDQTPMGKIKITKIEGKFALGKLESGIIKDGFQVIAQPGVIPPEEKMDEPPPSLEPEPVEEKAATKTEEKNQAPETKEKPNLFGSSYFSLGMGTLNSDSITDNTNNNEFTPDTWTNYYLTYGSVGNSGFLFETELFYGIAKTDCTAVNCTPATTFDNTEYGINFYLGYYFSPNIYLKLGAGGRYLNFENSATIPDFQLFGYQYGGALGFQYQFNSFFFCGFEMKYMLSQFSKSISDTPTLDLSVDIEQSYTNYLFRFGFIF